MSKNLISKDSAATQLRIAFKAPYYLWTTDVILSPAGPSTMYKAIFPLYTLLKEIAWQLLHSPINDINIMSETMNGGSFSGLQTTIFIFTDWLTYILPFVTVNWGQTFVIQLNCNQLMIDPLIREKRYLKDVPPVPNHFLSCQVEHAQLYLL